MPGRSASPERLNAQQRSAHIRQVVLAHGEELRRRYPILLHQDALGVGILAFALAGMIGSALLYINGYLAGWACLLLKCLFRLVDPRVGARSDPQHVFPQAAPAP